MAKDFRSGQVRTGKIIASDSKLYIYPASDAPDFNGTLPTGVGSGTDTFLYISGSIGSRGTATPGTLVVGGDAVVSGSLLIRDNIEISDTQITGSSAYRIKNIELTPVTDDEAASKFYVDLISSSVGNQWIQDGADLSTTGSVAIGTGSKATDIDPSLSLYVKEAALFDQEVTLSSSLKMSFNNITEVAAPVDDNDAAIKKYVDDSVAIAVGQIARVEQTFPSGSGDHDFSLSFTPLSGSQVIMSVNGVIYENGTDFGVTGSDVNWTATKFTLEPDDFILFDYHST